MDVTVCVATYGHPWWSGLAQRRAVPSIYGQAATFRHYHGTSLHQARSRLLDMVETEYVCFLDADDELEPGYIEAMAAGTADIRAPSVRYVIPGNPDRAGAYIPRVAGHRHDCAGACLPEGNWIVIGAVAKTAVVKAAGGFHEHPWSEDWCLWVRCWQAGVTIERIPEAVYRAHVRADSRNRSGTAAERLEYHREIARELGLPVP